MLETAFAGTPIQHEIIGYTTADENDADPSFKTITAAHAKRGDSIKTRAIGLYEFRRYDSSRAEAMRSIGNMTRIPLGMTPTSDAILLTHDRLARRPETRHVMFVLTDGAADSQKRCLDAVKAVDRCGVTVIGIGIGSNGVQHCFGNAVALGSAEELPTLMMSHLSAILIGEKHKIALKGRSAQRREAHRPQGRRRTTSRVCREVVQADAPTNHREIKTCRREWLSFISRSHCCQITRLNSGWCATMTVSWPSRSSMQPPQWGILRPISAFREISLPWYPA